jgi:hypothetical protein
MVEVSEIDANLRNRTALPKGQQFRFPGSFFDGDAVLDLRIEDATLWKAIHISTEAATHLKG